MKTILILLLLGGIAMGNVPCEESSGPGGNFGQQVAYGRPGGKVGKNVHEPGAGGEGGGFISSSGYWESIDSNTSRLKTPAGWIVKVVTYNNVSPSLVFVPDPKHKWEVK